MMRKGIVLAAGLAAVVVSIAGCRVRTEKDANGDEKNVQVDTPFGGVHVNTDQLTASDLGLPIYPGAQPMRDDDKHKSADVHMGFGEWQLRVRAVSYGTPDAKDKVVAFYKKALGRFGDVLTCQGDAPVGTPTTTAEGLNCADTGRRSNFQFNGNKSGIPDPNGLQLKAGSKRHQHIVAFEEPEDGKLHFTLVALDLPAGLDSKDNKSD